MNAERLHVIARAIKSEMEATEVVELLQQLTNHLYQQIQQPQQPQHQWSTNQTTTPHSQ